MNINIEIDKKCFSPTLYPQLLDWSHRIEMYKGSAGSGKSYFITQKIVYRCLQEKIRVMVCRRYGSTLRNSCFALFKEVLEQWRLLPYLKIRESDFNIKFPNGSEIIMVGLDEETKLLSLANITVIFIEEIYEISQNMFEQLNLRLRGGTRQTIIGAFNPISRNHWLYNLCVEQPPQSFFFSQTTYKDNPFLSKEYISALEELRTRNPQKFKVFGLGEWGLDNEGLVFRNWRIEEFDPLTLASSGLEHRTGMDFGFVDPTTIMDTLFDRQNKTIYVFNSFYKTGCQYDEIEQKFNEMNLRKQKIYCDSAEPRTIAYFQKRGFNTVPCIKGQDSVQARIAFLQNNTIILHPSCVDAIREFENFAYIADKQTNTLTQKTTHEFSHTIDALGYAYSDIYTSGKLKSVDKRILGL